MPRGTPAALVGQRFGAWTVKEKLGLDKHNQVMWSCTCECGRSAPVSTHNLVGGKSTRCRSCGNSRKHNKRWAKPAVTAQRPLLLIDVDGPLNPYASSHNTMNKRNRQAGVDRRFVLHRLLGYKVWLNKWHGHQLLTLADQFELTWCTTWEHDANVYIGPRLGLPELPVLEFDKKRIGSDDGTYFKTHEIVAFVAGRAFAWVDDEIGDKDQAYVTQHHHGPAKLLQIDPATGLTQDHFDTLATWAAALEVNTEPTGGT